MPHTKRPSKVIRTTVGDLASAYFEAALAELKDESQAARVAERMVAAAVKQGRVLVAHAS